MQNIGAGNADDAFYRYKMPKLVAKVEGRGNGIKTNVVNNVDVAKALERSPEYVLKFFGCELGAQTNYDAKSGTCIVNGAHDINKLNELLEGFIKRYVQCYSCGNPETILKIKKDDIFLKCKACGFVSDVDMRHKLNTFILKNPPENKLRKEEIKLKKAEEQRMADAQALEKKEKKDKKERKSERGENGEKKEKKEKKDKKKKKKEGDVEGDEGEGSGDAEKEEGANSSESAEEEADDGVVWMTDTSAEAVKKRAEEQLTAATAAMVTQGNLEAEQAEQRKREKEAARKAEEDAAAAAKQAAADVHWKDANGKLQWHLVEPLFDQAVADLEKQGTPITADNIAAELSSKTGTKISGDAVSSKMTRNKVTMKQPVLDAKERQAVEKAQAQQDAANSAAAEKAAAEIATATAGIAGMSVNGNGSNSASSGAGETPVADEDVARLLPLLAGRDAAGAVAAELKKMSVEGGLAGRMRVLYAAVFSASDDKLAAALKASKAVLLPHSADAAGQLAQLIALEHYLAVSAPERVKETPLALKALYDLDLVEDDKIIAWAAKADVGKILGVPAEGGAAVRAAAAPVVDWLQEEEESEEEED